MRPTNYITPHFGSNHYFRFLIRKCPGAVTMINSRGMSPLEEVARYRKKNINDDRGISTYTLFFYFLSASMNPN
eukprot:gene10991-22968_t